MPYVKNDLRMLLISKFALLPLGVVLALTLGGCASTPDPAVTPTQTGSAIAGSEEPTSTPTPTAAPTSGALGTELSTENWKITVIAADAAAGSEQAQRIADPGKKFVALDISACAIPATLDFPYRDMAIVDTDGRSWTFWNVQIGAIDPNLTDTASTIPAGQCTRGWLTILLDEAAVPSTVTFSDADANERLTWAVA